MQPMFKPMGLRQMKHMIVRDLLPDTPQTQALAKAIKKGPPQPGQTSYRGGCPNAAGGYRVTAPTQVVLPPDKKDFLRLLGLGTGPNKMGQPYRDKYHESAEPQCIVFHATLCGINAVHFLEEYAIIDPKRTRTTQRTKHRHILA